MDPSGFSQYRCSSSSSTTRHRRLRFEKRGFHSMTAEAVVMNKSAVAMAADSAVTITRGRSGTKIYDTANKLFELVKGRPVGIMVYSSAEMNGVPWETIIKTYRTERSGFTADTLKAYVEDFLNFLNASNSYLFSRESEGLAFERVAFEQFVAINSIVDGRFRTCLTRSGTVIKKKLMLVFDDAIAHVEDHVKERDDGKWDGLNEEIIRQKYGTRLTKLINETYKPKLKLTNGQVKRLENLVILSCLKEVKEDSGSGVVIAGFGEHDPFPSLHSIDICDRIAGVVRSKRHSPVVIGQKNSGAFRTFAQDEMASQFVTGINHKTRREVTHFWGTWMRDARKALLAEIERKHPKMSKGTVASIGDLFGSLSETGEEEFVAHMNKHQKETFVDPLVSSIAFLPKDELAHMAETLVNLTSVIQRFSIYRDETVGGEIDVALISRGDGLVWLKRKHYFSLELNPFWNEAK